MKQLLYILLFGGLISCNTKKQSLEFPSEKQISTSLSIEDLKIGIPDNMFFLDSILVLNDYKATEDYISFFSVKQQSHISSFGRKGKGPNEMITPLLSNTNRNQNILTFFDPNLKLMQVWSTEKTLLQQFNLDFIEVMLLKAYYVNEDLIIGLGFLKEGLFCMINPKNKSYRIVEDFPIMPYNEKSHELSSANSGRIKFFPDHNRFIFSMSNAGYMACFQINNGNIEKEWEKWITKPKYEIDNKNIIWNKNNKLGFMDIAISNKNIFGLYSGREMAFKNGRDKENLPDNILIFDHQGNPLKKCIVDTPIMRIAADHHNRLYGISLSSTFDLVEIKL